MLIRRMVLTCVAIVLFAGHSALAEQLMYLASLADKRIDVYTIDPENGDLTKKHSVGLPGNAGPMVFSPDHKFVYAAMTMSQNGKQIAQVATLARKPNGSLKILTTANIKSRAPYITVNPKGTFLLAAHYGAGDVTAYRIKHNSCTDEMTSHKVTAKTAHCIVMDADGRYAFVPHTSPNRVYQFKLDDKSGELQPNDPPFVTGPNENHQYHQPRHIAFHPTLKMAFTSNERGGGISAWKYDASTGRLKLSETLSTLPPKYEGGSAAADIQITPNGKFVYVSNRDTAKREDGKHKDTLAAFSIDSKSGKLSLVGHYPTEFFPRSFAIDVTGRFVYAAGQRSDKLAAYRINAKSGALTATKTYEVGKVPIWVMCTDK